MACSCGCNGAKGGCGQGLGLPCSCGTIRVRVARLIRLPVVPVGELRGVIYRARRSPAEPMRNYVHFFERCRPLLATNANGSRLYIVGGSYRVSSKGIVG